MWKDLKLPDGRDRVVRHGHGPRRAIQTGVGPVEVRRAKGARSRRGGGGGENSLHPRPSGPAHAPAASGRSQEPRLLHDHRAQFRWKLLPANRSLSNWKPYLRPRKTADSGYSSNPGKSRLVQDCVVGPRGLEPATRPSSAACCSPNSRQVPDPARTRWSQKGLAFGCEPSISVVVLGCLLLRDPALPA